MIPEHDIIPYQTSPLPEGPWLVFSPHPDDETFGMGGSLLLAHQQNIVTTVVCLTDGALGGTDKHDQLVALREAEARAAAKVLGVNQLEFWQQSDRGLIAKPELIRRIIVLVEQLSPGSVFFPSPLELHPDHRAAAALVAKALAQADYQGNCFTYEITVQFRVNYLIDISAVKEQKKQAMACYQSQLSENNYLDFIQAMDLARTYTLPTEQQAAEGYFRLLPLRQYSLKQQTENLLSPYLESLAALEKNYDLTVIWVHYHTPELLKLSVMAVVEDLQNTGLKAQLLVVDNGSASADIEIMEALPVELIKPDKNLGYAGGINLGVRNSQAEHIMVLNPDVLVEPGCIKNLNDSLAEYVASGPAFYLEQDKLFRMPPTEGQDTATLLINIFANRYSWVARLGRAHWRRRANQYWQLETPAKRYLLSGALMIFRKQTWHLLGGWDEDYPLYFEETDWLLRLKNMSEPVGYIPQASAIHLYAQSTRNSSNATAWFKQSEGIFQKKHFPEWKCRLLKFLKRKFVSTTELSAPKEFGNIPDSPCYLEIAASVFGYPAARARIEDPVAFGETLGAALSLQLPEGRYYLMWISLAGKEAALRHFDVVH